MRFLLLFLNVIIMIVAPVLLGRFIAAKRKASWSLFAIGAVTFIASQVGHIPFNWLIQQRWQLLPTDISVRSNLVIVSLFLGLSAGVFEETARYLTYRFYAKKARSWGQGLMLGAGHGGIEAIILGTLLAVNYIVLARMRSGSLLFMVPDDQLPLVKAQIDALFTAPWHLIILGAVERLFALCFHLSASLLVLQVFIRGQTRWLFASILWHTLLNAVALYAVVTWNAYITEGLIGVLALVSLIIVFRLRRPEPVEPELEPLPPVPRATPVELDVTAEMLDKSRYT